MARFRFQTKNLFIAGGATVFATLPVLAFAGYKISSASHHIEPTVSENFQAAASMNDSTPPPIEPAPLNDTSVNVQVNGRKVSVPANGSTHQVINDSSGQTVVDISSEQSTQGQAGSSSYSSTSVQINSVLNNEQTDD